MWARLIGALVVLGFIAFLIAGAYYSVSQIQARLVERGVLTGTVSPLQGFRETVQGWVQTIVYWASMVAAGIVGITVAVCVGRAMVRSRRLLGVIPLGDLQRHLLILGPTGSGKTNTAKEAIKMAVGKAVRVTILDWKGEYVGFVENATVVRKINPWDVGGRSPRERAALAVEMLREVTRDVADVSSASAALLLREMVRLYEKGVPKTSEVVNALETFFSAAMAERRLAEANMAAALLRRLTWLQIDEERPAENVLRSGQVVIYDLSQTGSAYLKTIYSLAILSKIYYDALGEGAASGLRMLLIAEECQNYVRGRRMDEPPSIGERIVNELRSFGVGVLMICPDPLQIPWHLARDVAAVVAIGAQSLPEFVLDTLRLYDVRRLQRILKSRALVYRSGRISVVRPPKRPPKTVRLTYVPPATQVKEEDAEKSSVVETVAETVAKPVAEAVAPEPSYEAPSGFFLRGHP